MSNKPFSHSRSLLSVLMLSCSLMACSVAHEYQQPEIGYTDNWQQCETQSTKDTAATAYKDWLNEYGDDALATLLQQAFTNNQDLLIMQSRIRQAEIALGSANANHQPSLSLSGGASRNLNNPTSGKTTYSNSISGLLSASYEPDLWGDIHAAIEQAQNNTDIAKANYQSEWLSISAEIASLYTEYRFLIEQKDIRKKILQNIQEIDTLSKQLNTIGRTDGDTIADTATQVENARISLEAITASMETTRNALAILVGVAPQDFTVPKAMKPFKQPTPETMLPSAMLQNRPDIRIAEANLRSANADITIAHASFLPNITLSASAGLSLANLHSAAAKSASVGTSIVQKIFNNGDLTANLETAQEKQNELVETYRQTVLTAFQDTQDALTILTQKQTALTRTQTIEANTQTTLQNDKKRFETGRIAKIELLQGINGYLNAKLQTLSATTTNGQAIISLYKAFGGTAVEE